MRPYMPRKNELNNIVDVFYAYWSEAHEAISNETDEATHALSTRFFKLVGIDCDTTAGRHIMNDLYNTHIYLHRLINNQEYQACIRTETSIVPSREHLLYFFDIMSIYFEGRIKFAKKYDKLSIASPLFIKQHNVCQSYVRKLESNLNWYNNLPPIDIFSEVNTDKDESKN